MHVFGLVKGHTWVCCFQGKKITWSKKHFNYHEYAHTKNAKGHIGLQWDDQVLLMIDQELCFHYGPHHETLRQNKGVWMDNQMLRSMGGHKTTILGCFNFNHTHMGHGVSHPHICVKFGSWGYVNLKSYWKMWSTNCIHL
jgi:hypothetical protein